MIDQTTKDALNQHIAQTLWKRGEYDINTYCGSTESHLELFPANVFDMTPDEYKELVEKKEQEEARRKALEREQNERQLLAKMKKISNIITAICCLFILWFVLSWFDVVLNNIRGQNYQVWNLFWLVFKGV